MDIDRLERLAALRDKGALSEEEFQREKSALVTGGSVTAPEVPTPIAHHSTRYEGEASPSSIRSGAFGGGAATPLILGSIVLEIFMSAYFARDEPNVAEIIKLELIGALGVAVVYGLIAWWAIAGKGRVGSSVLLLACAALTLTSIFVGFDDNPSMRIPTMVLNALGTLSAFQFMRSVWAYRDD